MRLRKRSSAARLRNVVAENEPLHVARTVHVPRASWQDEYTQYSSSQSASVSQSRHLQGADLTTRSCHSLRHFFITELCRRGAPTMVVKQLAGHAELSTTQRYAHMVASDLGAAIALFAGPATGKVR